MNYRYRFLPLAMFILALGAAMYPAGAQAQTPDGAEQKNPLHIDARVTAPPDDMFVDLVVNNHQIYLGETLKIEYDVYVASKLGQVYYDAEEPDFAKWTSIEGMTLQPSPASFLGKSYTREPFAVFFVTPSIPGKVPLPQLKVQVPYIQTKPWITQEPKIIDVLPLPDPKPDGFFRGNVGQFTFHEEHGDTHVRVGDIITFNITISGNAQGLELDMVPYQLKTNADAFRIYDPIYEGLDKKAGKDEVTVTKRIRFRILALKEGEWTLPPFSFVSFDPDTHTYKTQTTQPVKVYVEPSQKLDNLEKTRPKPLFINRHEIADIHLSTPFTLAVPRFVHYIPISLFILMIIGAFIIDHRKRIQKGVKKRLKTQSLIQGLSTAETSDIQYEYIAQLFALRYNIDIRQDNFKENLEKIFDTQDAALILRVIQDIKMASFSTHKPIQNAQLEKCQNILRSSK